jgi:hypothetical protein
MAQTDFPNLADALATAGAEIAAAGTRLTTAGAGISAASQECERLPIVLAIRDNQALIDLINQKHDQTTQQINTLRTDITTLRTDMTNRLDAR